MKINLFIVIIILTQIHINAQELSLNFDVGYGFKIVPESSAESYNLTENVAEYKAFTYSYGKGLNLNLEIEYTPKEEYLGFGLGLGYLKSSKVNYSYSGGVFGLVNNIQLKGSMFRLSPFIKLKFNKNKIQYFSRLGYLMGLHGQISRETAYMYNSGNAGSTIVEFKKGISHGVTVGFGLEYKITSRFNIISEFRLFIQSFGPKKSELVVAIRNGKDDLPNLELSSIHTNHVDNFIIDSDSNTNVSEPGKGLRRFYPFSSIGLNLGIQYKLISKD